MNQSKKCPIELDGDPIYIEYQKSFENRPTLVFLHDSLGCVELWRDFPQRMGAAAECNTLIYDRLGYGKSGVMHTHIRPINYIDREAETLDALLTVLNINDAILFGHSDGGSIALIAAAKYGNRIKAIICEAAHIFVEDITLKGITAAIEAYRSTNLPERLERYHGDKVESIFRAWTETWLRPDFRNWNIEWILPNVRCPLLFIQGADDEYGSLEQVERTVSQTGGRSYKHIIANTGHTPHKDVPDEVIEVTARFLLSLEQARDSV